MTGAHDVSGAPTDTSRPPAPLHALVRVLDAAFALTRLAIVAILAGLVLVVASQVVDRHAHPIWGGIPAEEYVKVGLVWLTFLGFAWALRGGVSVRIDLIDTALPARHRRVLHAGFDVVLLVLLGSVLYKGARLYAISTGQLILGTDMTVAVPVLGMLVGLALAALAIVERLLLRERAARRAVVAAATAG